MPLLGRISDEDLILLSASPNKGAGMVEGSGVQSEEDWGKELLHRGVSRQAAMTKVVRATSTPSLAASSTSLRLLSRWYLL